MRKRPRLYRKNHWNPFKETEYYCSTNAGIMTHSRASHIKKMENLLEPMCTDFPFAISFKEEYRWWPWNYTSEEERDRDFELLRKWGWKTDKEVV